MKKSKEEQDEERKEEKRKERSILEKVLETLLEQNNTSVAERCKRRGLSVSTYYRMRKRIIASLSALLKQG